MALKACASARAPTWGLATPLSQRSLQPTPSLRKIEDLINDLNRKFPFAKEREVQLP